LTALGSSNQLWVGCEKISGTLPHTTLYGGVSKERYIYVINGGVPSYTSSQTLLYMQEILEKAPIEPKTILVNIMWNDIWYSSVKNWHPNILVHQKPPEWLSFLTTKLLLYLWLGKSDIKAE